MPSPSDTIRGELVDAQVRGTSFWGVAKVRTRDGKTIAVTGSLLGLSPGETVECRGAWDNHPRWGAQFKARAIEVVQPTEASGVIAWLALRLPNVGRTRAERMVATFGVPGIWDVLERAPERLAEVEGVTPARAKAIAEAYEAHRAERDRMVLLQSWGLTQGQIGHLAEAWGTAMVDRLRADPYSAIEEVHGFGFRRADAVAQRMGLAADSRARVRAGVMHILKESRERGHTYVPAPKLVAMAAKLLDLDPEEHGAALRGALFELRDGRRIVGGGGRARLPELAVAEVDVAVAIRRRLGLASESSAAGAEGEAE